MVKVSKEKIFNNKSLIEKVNLLDKLKLNVCSCLRVKNKFISFKVNDRRIYVTFHEDDDSKNIRRSFSHELLDLEFMFDKLKITYISEDFYGHFSKHTIYANILKRVNAADDLRNII